MCVIRIMNMAFRDNFERQSMCYKSVAERRIKHKLRAHVCACVGACLWAGACYFCLETTPNPHKYKQTQVVLDILGTIFNARLQNTPNTACTQYLASLWRQNKTAYLLHIFLFLLLVQFRVTVCAFWFPLVYATLILTNNRTAQCLIISKSTCSL